MNIAPQNIENLLKADPFISQVMVHGDRRPYPVALITLNPEELAQVRARAGRSLTADPAALAKHPKIVERVARTVEEKNTNLQSYAKVKKFADPGRGLHQEGGELTPDAEGQAQGRGREVQGGAGGALRLAPRRWPDEGRGRHRGQPRPRPGDGGGAGGGRGRRRGGGAIQARAGGDRAAGRARAARARWRSRPTWPLPDGRAADGADGECARGGSTSWSTTPASPGWRRWPRRRRRTGGASSTSTSSGVFNGCRAAAPCLIAQRRPARSSTWRRCSRRVGCPATRPTRDQGRGHRADAGARRRVGAPQHPGQRDRARLVRDRR